MKDELVSLWRDELHQEAVPLGPEALGRFLRVQRLSGGSSGSRGSRAVPPGPEALGRYLWVQRLSGGSSGSRGSRAVPLGLPVT